MRRPRSNGCADPSRTFSTVIDLGAGTGQFSLRAAEHWTTVVAIDPSPVMLRELRRKVAAPGVSVSVVEGGCLTFDRPAGGADLAHSRYALHHLADSWKALALLRMRTMLRRGGILRLWDIVYDFPVAEAGDRIEEWCSTGYSSERAVPHRTLPIRRVPVLQCHSWTE